MNLAFSHLHPEYQDYLWDKRLDSFESIEKYGREFEKREAIKERYRSPTRRDRAKIPGTTYTGPHRASHKVIAVVESSSSEDSGSPTTKKGKKPKEERQKGTGQGVAAMNNRTTTWPSGDRTGRNTLAPAPRRPATPATGQKPPGGETSGLTSSPAPYCHQRLQLRRAA